MFVATALANAEEGSLETDHRRRLLDGMCRAVAEKGYADTTITDIVSAAAVSRRTFYEHFATKADCLIALYESACAQSLHVLRQAIDRARPWDAQLEDALAAYFHCLAENPPLLRTLFVEIIGLGPRGMLARRRSNDDIAELILETARARPQDRWARPLSADMALAVVGGINELLMRSIEQDRVAQLHELVAPACLLVRLVVGGSADAVEPPQSAL